MDLRIHEQGDSNRLEYHSYVTQIFYPSFRSQYHL